RESMDERTNYWKRVSDRRVSRRSALRGAGVAGFGLAGAALIGCGSDDDDPEPTPTSGNGGGGAATATGPSTATGTGTATGDVQRGGTVTAALLNDPPTLDPFGNTSVTTKSMAVHAYSRLFKLGTGPEISAGEAAPVPDLAESAETEDG